MGMKFTAYQGSYSTMIVSRSTAGKHCCSLQIIGCRALLRAFKAMHKPESLSLALSLHLSFSLSFSMPLALSLSLRLSLYVSTYSAHYTIHTHARTHSHTRTHAHAPRTHAHAHSYTYTYIHLRIHASPLKDFRLVTQQGLDHRTQGDDTGLHPAATWGPASLK